MPSGREAEVEGDLRLLLHVDRRFAQAVWNSANGVVSVDRHPRSVLYPALTQLQR